MMNVCDMPAGPEMDLLIATKVMGWGDCVEHHPMGWILVGPYHVGMWSPSTEIQKAWEVVKKMNGNGYIVRINSGPDSAMCRIIDSNGDGIASNFCETAPLAICRAALLAVQSK